MNKTKLGDILPYEQPSKYIVNSTKYSDSYKTPVLTAGKTFLLGYTNETDGIYTNLPCIIFDDFTTATKYVNFPFKVKSSAMKILTSASDDINLKYYFYMMQTIYVDSQTHKRFWISEYSKLDVKHPPLPEQNRIVEKLDELFSELDNGIGTLQKTKAQLKVYRQAVVTNALEAAIANGCDDVILNEISETIRNGYSKKPEDNGKYKILRISAVRALNVNINDFRLLENLPSENDCVSENDLLFTRYNGSFDYVGVCGQAKNIQEPLAYPDKLIKCRLKNTDYFHSAYIMYYMNFGETRKYIRSKIKTTAGQCGISGTEIKNTKIKLPKYQKQVLAVQEIEARLSICDQMEKTVDESLRQAESLRQSILKQAFEGRLV